MKRKLSAEEIEYILAWFLRVLAAVFLVFGLSQWWFILDISGTGRFAELELVQQAIVGFFAVIDLVAFVGLWLIAPWGVVVWLIAALSDIGLHAFFSDLAVTPFVLIIFHLITMLAYLWLAVTHARQRIS